MPPRSKKFKSSTSLELEVFQKEIEKIKGQEVVEAKPPLPDTDSNENDEEAREIFIENNDHSYRGRCDEDDMKKFIREQIQLSEHRVHQQLDRIEKKLNQLIEKQTTEPSEQAEEVLLEEHLLEIEDRKVEANDVGSMAFPIEDEAMFEWFFERLRDEDYRNQLIESRWTLTAKCSTKFYHIAVKDFIRLHFDLAVCVKYSVSGFGSHGSRKKKLDSETLATYIFECFNLAFPYSYTFKDTLKAITQFWGRAPDVLNKKVERSLKRESIKIE